ncbi:MAG: dihydroorotate dehydrogenase-like protein [Deltaproteobacteria bacterium]|nr:dihydroorotate dehydrogenase-like protein [Deltaproteobacteria bacterium]
MSVDLQTTYLGLTLKNPIVAGASPLTGHLDELKELEGAGVGAVVFPSLFEEQIEHEEMALARVRDFGAESFPESLHFFPELDDYNTGPGAYLRRIEEARTKLSIPVIASLNGQSTGGWIRHARLMQEAGASAVELNIYHLPSDLAVSGQAVEQRYVELVEAVRAEVTIPLAVKIGPYFSSVAHLVGRLVAAGADGVVLFNRYLFPDIDVEALEVRPHLQLSTAAELLLPLRWIAILHGRVKTSLAASSGAVTSNDVVKLLLAGADVVMLVSSLLRYGTAYPAQILAELESWLADNDYESVRQLQGSLSQLHSPNPEAFERANYMRALASFTSERP